MPVRHRSACKCSTAYWNIKCDLNFFIYSMRIRHGFWFGPRAPKVPGYDTSRFEQKKNMRNDAMIEIASVSFAIKGY